MITSKWLKDPFGSRTETRLDGTRTDEAPAGWEGVFLVLPRGWLLAWNMWPQCRRTGVEGFATYSGGRIDRIWCFSPWWGNGGERLLMAPTVGIGH